MREDSGGSSTGAVSYVGRTASPGTGGGRLQVGRGPAGVEVALDALGVLDAEHDGVDRATGQREALKSQRSLNLSELKKIRS